MTADTNDDRGCLKNSFPSLANYYRHNTNIIVFAFMLGVLAFGYELFNFTLSVDEEANTFVYNGLEWIAQGRWSNYLLLKLFQPESLMPWIPTFFAVIFLMISCLLFFELIDGDGLSKAIFCCLFVTFPSNAFFMEFNTYNFAVSIGIALTIASVLLIKKYLAGGSKWLLLPSVGAAAFAFGVYQSLIGLWFCLCFIYCLYELIINGGDGKTYYLKSTLISATVFCSGIVLYKLVDFGVKLLFDISSSRYLDNMAGWSRFSFTKSYDLLSRNILSHFAGKAFFGEGTIGLIWVLLVCLLITTLRLRGLAIKLLGVMSIFMILLSPFFLSIGLGSPLPVRSLVALPMMVAGLAYLVALTTRFEIRQILLVTTLIISIVNSCTITRLFYSDHLNGQADRDLANRIIDRVLMLDIPFDDNVKIPIAFVGQRKREANEAFIRSEVFGSSYFEFGGPSQRRIHYFLKTLGVEGFSYANSEQMILAIEECKSMKKWPHKDSVQFNNGMVIVKLGEATEKQLTGKTH